MTKKEYRLMSIISSLALTCANATELLKKTKISSYGQLKKDLDELIAQEKVEKFKYKGKYRYKLSLNAKYG